MEKSSLEAELALRIFEETRPSDTVFEWFCKEDSVENKLREQRSSSPPGYYYFTDNVFVNNDADVTSLLEEAFSTLPRGKSWAAWLPRYPRSRHPAPDIAIGIQSDHYFVIHLICEERGEAVRLKMWLQNTVQKLFSHSVGSYIGDSDLRAEYKWYWGEENSRRLMSIRDQWDPQGLFAATHNGPG